MTDADDSTGSPRDVLVECLRHPDRGKQRLPRVVGMLESDDPAVRVSAAWTACLVASEHPDTVEYLVRRLSDRLTGDQVSLELTSALDYLAARYPGTVEEVVDELEDEAAERGDIPLPRTGNFTRSYYYGGEPTREGMGRTRIAGADTEGSPRRTYAGSDPEYHERADLEEHREEAPGVSGGGGSEADEPALEEESHADEDARADEEASADDEFGGNPGALVRRTTDVSAIAIRSRFDQLHVLASRDRGRYADVYQALVGQGGEEQAVALQILHLPDDESQRPSFEEDVGRELHRWASVDDHAHVTSLLDWGVEPRPWLATKFAGESLADHDRFGLDRALSDAIDLADALSHVHRNDVVHAGIDPKNVAYPDDVLEGNDQDPPLLTNVGLMHVYRFHREPALCLDPRYAAPEYFDRQYGGVDHATDIYQLGAVVFRLVTGRAPFGGSLGEVRDRVLDREPPAPSDLVATAPERLDDVIAKAMSKQKLTRYEAVEHLRQELVAVREGFA